MTLRIFWISCLLIAGTRAAALPVVTGVSPDPIDAGGEAFLMTITGTGFVYGAVASLPGSALSTTFVNSSQLLGEITPALRALSGHPGLTVANPGGGVSNGWQIHISPVVGAIIPSAALAGGPAVTITVTGIGITAADVLVWSAAGEQTLIPASFVDSKTLTAVIPAALLSTAQSAGIQIAEPHGVTSATSAKFDVLAAPVIASLSPNPVDAGGEYFLVTVTGAGFVRNSVVNWAGVPLGTTYVSPTQLQAAITPGLRAISGTFPITVSNSGVAASAAAPFTVSPVLFSVSPALATAGGAALYITATGVGFTRNDVLIFNATGLVTTYFNATTLMAVIAAAALRSPGAATVQVSDSNGAGRSLPQGFPIIAGPAIASIVPASTPAGSPAFTLTVAASNCPAGCVVEWNGSPLTTTHPSDASVTAWVPADLVAAAGTAGIRLVNQHGDASNTAVFTIGPAAAFLTSLSPGSATAGSGAFQLTVTGTGFVAGSTVRWNGSGLATSDISATRATAYVTADLVTLRAGNSAMVTVLSPGGAESNSLTLYIDPPRPAILSLSPASAAAGGTALAIAITGTNFAFDCVVRWSGTAVGTAFLDAGHISASVPATLLVNPGVVPLTVTNPSGLVSGEMTFTLIPSAPAAESLSPRSVTEGAPAFILMVNGAYFTRASTVRWNNSALATVFLSPSQVTAIVAASLVAAAGNASITVSNPGGLISQAVGFVVATASAATLPAPAITPGGVVNAFSSTPSMTPGALISIYGTNLVAVPGQATATPLPKALNGTSVSINGSPVPLLFVSATQINAQAPFALPLGTASLVVHSGTLKSGPEEVAVKASAPGVLAQPGGTHALAVNFSTGALNGTQNPAHPGEYVIVYVTGQGLLDHALADGEESTADPLSRPLAMVRATLGGIAADVDFAGMAPGFVGLLQVNLRIPEIPAGEQALELMAGGVAANQTVLSVAAKR